MRLRNWFSLIWKLSLSTVVSRIEDPVRLFFFALSPNLYVLFGSICLIVLQEKKWGCILIRDSFFYKIVRI